jgi:hypothetical protein
MEIDLSAMDMSLLQKLIDHALLEREFVVYVNTQGKFLKGFEEDPDMELAVALVEDSPHFIATRVGFGITHYGLHFDVD